MSSPDPLIASDVDLRDFAYMPIDIRRLLTSETWLTSSGDEKAAAMTLWLESWHQVPAGSLPDNDRMLAVLSQAGGRWRKVKEAALRGWVKCSDGRLYHPVVCEKANDAWAKKIAQRQRTQSARDARRHRTVTDDTTDDATLSVTEDVTGSKGKGEGKERGSEAKASAPPAGEWGDDRSNLFGGALQWLEKHSGRPKTQCKTIIGRWLKLTGNDYAAVLGVIREARDADVADPVPWIEAALKPKPNGHAKETTWPERAAIYQRTGIFLGDWGSIEDVPAEHAALFVRKPPGAEGRAN